jgi:hypothetical protein
MDKMEGLPRLKACLAGRINSVSSFPTGSIKNCSVSSWVLVKNGTRQELDSISINKTKWLGTVQQWGWDVIDRGKKERGRERISISINKIRQRITGREKLN